MQATALLGLTGPISQRCAPDSTLEPVRLWPRLVTDGSFPSGVTTTQRLESHCGPAQQQLAPRPSGQSRIGESGSDLEPRLSWGWCCLIPPVEPAASMQQGSRVQQRPTPDSQRQALRYCAGGLPSHQMTGQQC